MIKIILDNKRTTKKVWKSLNCFLKEKYFSETIHNTTWFDYLYLKIYSYACTITINIFNSKFVSDEVIKEVLKESLKDESSFILYYNDLLFFVDSLSSNEKVFKDL